MMLTIDFPCQDAFIWNIEYFLLNISVQITPVNIFTVCFPLMHILPSVVAPMDLNTVREWLEGGGDRAKEKAAIQNLAEEASPFKFFNVFTCKGITVDHIEHGRLLCSLKVPPRLTNEVTVISVLLF